MDGAQAPESYAETSMEFEKGTIQVYQQDGADTCPIYAMNSEGQKDGMSIRLQIRHIRHMKYRVVRKRHRQTEKSSR